jgi:serine/threonine protein kinase
MLLYTTCGTPNYVAPEVLSDRGYEGTAADIWSCGVILFVFLAGYLPFEETSTELLFRKIQRAQYKCPSWFPAGAKGNYQKHTKKKKTRHETDGYTASAFSFFSVL